MKTLKINEKLHTKLKQKASENNTILQDLIENKLEEIIESKNESFETNNIYFLKNKNLFSIELTPKNYKSLISLLKKLCLNERIKDINQMNNILDSIKILELEYDKCNLSEDKIHEENTNELKEDNNIFSKYNLGVKKEEQYDFTNPEDFFINTSLFNSIKNKIDNIKEDKTKDKKGKYTNKIFPSIYENFTRNKKNISNYFLIKINKKLEKDILNLAGEKGIKHANGILEKPLYFNLNGSNYVKDFDKKPKIKNNYVEVYGFSKIDGRLILKAFNSNSDLKEKITKPESDKFILKETKTLTLYTLYKNSNISIQMITNKEFNNHYDNKIFKKHFLINTVIQCNKTNEQKEITDIKIKNGKIVLNSKEEILFEDLYYYKLPYYMNKNEIIKDLIIKSNNGTTFKIDLKDHTNNNPEDIEKLRNNIQKIMKEKNRSCNIKIKDNLHLLEYLMFDDIFYFSGNFYDLNSFYNLDFIATDIRNEIWEGKIKS